MPRISRRWGDQSRFFCIFEKIRVQKSLRLSTDIRILLISAITRELKFQAGFCYISRKALFITHPKIFWKSPIPTEIFLVAPLSLWHCPEIRHFWELCSDRQQQINQLGIAPSKVIAIGKKSHVPKNSYFFEKLNLHP